MYTRHEEITPAISSVAGQSVSAALQEEQELSQAAGEAGGITFSADRAWQTRGSGRGHNSASSGHATAVGAKTGKCVGYGQRAKQSPICYLAKTK